MPREFHRPKRVLLVLPDSTITVATATSPLLLERSRCVAPWNPLCLALRLQFRGIALGRVTGTR